MIETLTIAEDQALKVLAAADHRPRQFNWGSVVEGQYLQVPMTLCAGEMETPFAAADVAEIVGSALTTLHLSRSEEEEIFSERNQQMVADVTRKVLQSLLLLAAPRSEKRISWLELHLAVEQALVHLQNYDVARSLLTHRAVSADAPVETLPVRLQRRSGQLVPWSTSKIEIAVRKAFLAQERDSAPAVDIAQAVARRVAESGVKEIRIEDVQDLVQEELLRAGHLDVAQAYFLYRARRSEQRAAATGEPLSRQQQLVRVVREDGSSYLWDGADLRARIRFAVAGLDLCLSVPDIEDELRRSVFDDLSESDLQTTVLLNAKALIERDADFARFAGRMLLTYIYEEVLEWSILKDGPEALKQAHEAYFRKGLERAIALQRLSPRLLEYDLSRLAEALDPSADLAFEYLGIQTLYDRYLIVDKSAAKSRRLETPQIFWMRVAMGLFLQEPGDREGWVIQLYGLYKERRFCSSTPTLFNSGTLRSQLSSCYLYKVDDSIESIMLRGIAENAFLSKWAGGLGGSWTSVRGTGSYIQGTNGESQGVIPFLKLHNDQLIAVNQGGKRRGSGCVYLETWHNDILDFLMLRRNTGDERRRTHDMNTANWIPDLFMKRMEARENWTLFRANETPDLHDLYGKAFEARYQQYEDMARRGEIYGQEMPALELWKQMLKMLFETGHPWITFKDACNVRSPQDHVGVIHSSNLCTEITLNTSAEETAVCNLGSVILDQHQDAAGNLDHKRLRETVRIALRALDNVIDINFYPTEAARTANMRHRPVGLGVMGLANALYRRDISFASEDALAFNDQFMEAIAYYAYEASSDLAVERGTYSSYKGSKWDRGLLPQDTLALLESERGVALDVPRGGLLEWEPLRAKIRKQGMRNSNVLAIAPTATISNIMATSPCIEPMYKNIFVKSNLSGDFIVLNTALVRDLKVHGLWDADMVENLKYFDGELASIERIPDALKEKYRTAFGIDHTFIVQAAARRQKWIDQAQSVNLFLGSPDMRILSHMYRAAWHSGLKTTYYLRTLGASNIEKATVNLKRQKEKETPVTEEHVSKEARVVACRLDAMLNGGECEACQ
jgi:ribonucleoside-diphosphate reductase alpha chain